MSHDDFDFEPVRGLPARLPEGESLLWQGSPDWRSLAVHAYHVRKIALYFAVLVASRAWIGMGGAQTGAAIALSCAWIAFLGIVAIAVLCGLAYFAARAAVYSVTSERVVLRQGVAVSVTINVPFALVESADLHRFADGSGDVYLQLRPDQRIGYLVTWPHVRPLRFARPQPSFRALADVEAAARILGAALAASAGAAAGIRIDAPPAQAAPSAARAARA